MNLKDVLYKKLLPPAYQKKDAANSYFLSNFMQAVADGGGQDMVDIIENLDDYLDPQICPVFMLKHLASWFNFDLLYWAGAFGWNTQKQRDIVDVIGVKLRYVGTKQGIIWFVENFIDNAKVIGIFEPWKRIATVSGSAVVSGNTRIRDSNYWRDCVIHVSVTNGGYHLRELLIWLVDPRVKIVITEIQSSDLTCSDAPLFWAKIENEKHTYQYDSTVVKVSMEPAVSMNKYISGKPSICWPINAQSQFSILENWSPLAGSIWRIDEISKSTEILKDSIKVSDEGKISGTHTIGGSRFIRRDTPLVNEIWEYFGDIQRED